MILLNTIRSRHFRALLKLDRSPTNCVNNPPYSPDSSHFSSHSSISLRRFSITAQFAKNAEEKIEKFREPLSVFFRRAFKAPQKSENSGVQAEGSTELKEKLRNSEEEVKSLKDKLRNLEEEIRSLNKERPERGKDMKKSIEKENSIERKEADNKGSLSALFGHKKTGEVKVVERIDFGHENPMVHKELSSDMQMFAHHLYKQGYLKDANFMPKNKFDLACFEVSYAREFLKFSAVNFGKDHQEIAKWLSAKDLKTVALFGCPSIGVRSVYAAKHMRRFFDIKEPKVCQKCPVKESCNHANKMSKASSKLNMASVTRVVTMYAMESVPQKLVVPEEVKESVSRLLKEIVTLTQDPS